MNPNLSYRDFSEDLKGVEIPSLGSGNKTEVAKRFAFLLIWLKFQFGWRMGNWELSLTFRYRPWVYLALLIALSCMVLLPVFIPDSTQSKSNFPVAITLPQLPTESVIAPDTLLNHVSLNQLCNDE